MASLLLSWIADETALPEVPKSVGLSQNRCPGTSCLTARFNGCA